MSTEVAQAEAGFRSASDHLQAQIALAVDGKAKAGSVTAAQEAATIAQSALARARREAVEAEEKREAKEEAKREREYQTALTAMSAMPDGLVDDGVELYRQCVAYAHRCKVAQHARYQAAALVNTRHDEQRRATGRRLPVDIRCPNLAEEVQDRLLEVADAENLPTESVPWLRPAFAHNMRPLEESSRMGAITRRLSALHGSPFLTEGACAEAAGK